MAELGKSLNGIQLKPPSAPLSAWAPLREPLFRSLWLAAVVCYTGRWGAPFAPAVPMVTV